VRAQLRSRRIPQTLIKTFFCSIYPTYRPYRNRGGLESG
jgi:hypothetical protein